VFKTSISQNFHKNHQSGVVNDHEEGINILEYHLERKAKNNSL